MKNFNLNPGGVIGGLGGLAVVLIASDNFQNERLGRMVAAGVIVGAILGNLIWSLLFGKPVDDSKKATPNAPPAKSYRKK